MSAAEFAAMTISSIQAAFDHDAEVNVAVAGTDFPVVWPCSRS